MSIWQQWPSRADLRAAPRNDGDEHKNIFGLLRFYSITSLMVMVITGILFILFIRKVAIQDIIEISEKNNLTFAQTALNEITPELLRYLTTVGSINPGEAVNVAPPEEFTFAIGKLLSNRAVVRIKIYNRIGTVVFSTQHDQVGEMQEGNGGFQSAIMGKVMSTLVYRDTFNSFDRETEDDNLMSTYIPVKGSLGGAIPGVFEIYTDASSLVSRNERTEFQILFGVVLILGFLYAMLLLIVRRASRVIDVQQQTIRERTATLELLSAHLLAGEEHDKKKIAVDLHEGLAQTLCTLKMVLTSSLADMPKKGKITGTMEQILPVLQSAIQEVQDIAQGLRPSSLDNLGLLPTLDWFFRSFERTHPQIRIDQNIDLLESDVPTPLKIVVYRIIESTLTLIARHVDTDRISFDLNVANAEIVLEIGDSAEDTTYSAASPADEANQKRHFAKIHEQVILSGGTFSAHQTAAGGFKMRTAWPHNFVDVSLDTEISIL